jgi:hypothetical protein
MLMLCALRVLCRLWHEFTPQALYKDTRGATLAELGGEIRAGPI